MKLHLPVPRDIVLNSEALNSFRTRSSTSRGMVLAVAFLVMQFQDHATALHLQLTFSIWTGQISTLPSPCLRPQRYLLLSASILDLPSPTGSARHCIRMPDSE